MSEPIPESTPTSADPRSHRPLKRARLSGHSSNANATATAAQASQIAALLADPERPINLPPPSSQSSKSKLAAPPEMVANVQGSSAGAGSGEFHVYKASRRREMERVGAMEKEAREEEERREWEEQEEKRRKEDEDRTRRKREKRLKKKTKKEKMGTRGGYEGGEDAGEVVGGGAVNGDAEQDAARNGLKNKWNGVKVPQRNAELGAPGGQEEANGEDEVGVVIHDDG